MPLICAGTGLTLKDLHDIFKTQKCHGLVAVLTEKFSGKPRVSNNETVIQKNLDYFNNYIANK